ncbi:MAG: hypothetical protein A2W80_06625 [Candidatus Riflebacteria bacterium GWC2_50_8]|nr:MAG: hypothetical protein A2W80_06625 [Candidatus Riflebacteria bacterium GWC2_50_8]
MKRRSICVALLLIILVFASLTGAQAQIRRDELSRLTGAQKMSPEEYLQIQQVKMVRSFTTLSGKPALKLPKAVDLSAEFPPIQRQTDQSCMAWTNAYAIKSYHERLEHGWEYGPNHLFSPTFLFNLLYERDADGNYVRDSEAMKFMVDEGAVPLSLFPYTPDDFTLPSEELKKFALAFRALTYRRLQTNDLYILKAMLASGEPVALTIPIYQEILDLSKKNPILRKIKSTEILSTHDLVAVGYDDSKNAIRIYNSWGTGWADQGCGWLDYSLWNNDFIMQATVTYDRPTPPEVATYLQDAKARLKDPLPDFEMMEATLPTAALSREDPAKLLEMAGTIVSYSPDQNASAAPIVFPEKVPIVIVPEEAGIFIADHWLRLGDELSQSGRYLIAKADNSTQPMLEKANGILVESGFMGPAEVGRFEFMSRSQFRVETSRGIGIASPRSKVRRIYRTPDDISADKSRDTYFFKTVTRDWGGVKFDNHAALEFFYDEKGMVNRISLFTAYLAAYTGQALKPIGDNEYQQETRGQVVTSKEGHLSFVMPAHFTKVDKVVWPNIGVGYFIKENPLNDTWMVTVKVFEVAGATRETLLAERIPADKKVYAMLNLKEPVPVTFADREWLMVEDAAGIFVNYYTVENSRYYQVNVATDARVTGEKWLTDFFSSFVISK